MGTLVAAIVALAVAARKELSDLIRAHYSIVYIVTHEESRVEAEISAVAKSRGLGIRFWGCSQGFTSNGTDFDGVVDPIGALQAVAGTKGRGIFVLRDFHVFLDDAAVRRWLRDLAIALRSEGRTIVILASTLKLPADLEKDVAVIDWPLPDREEISALFDNLTAQLKGDKRESANQAKGAIVEAALGLTVTETENTLAKAAVQPGPMEVKDILKAKRDIIRKAGVLEYQETSAKLEDVGGLDELKGWLVRRRKAFSPEARAFGIDVPKGTLVVGVPGTGKTLCAKAIAAAWGMPLLRMDISRLLGSFVGESEGKLAQAIKTAEAVAPCVLLVDELEKALAGAGSDSSGVSTRMLGTLLQWMQEKTAPVYVVATANDVSALPPELLRKGRFDEVWFVDLPETHARMQILATHLDKRGHEVSDDGLWRLAEASEGYVGAELEQAIVEALCVAFDADRKPTDGDIYTAIKGMVPLSVTMKERIEWLRNWAKGRARNASRKVVESTNQSSRRIDLSDEGVN